MNLKQRYFNGNVTSKTKRAQTPLDGRKPPRLAEFDAHTLPGWPVRRALTMPASGRSAALPRRNRPYRRAKRGAGSLPWSGEGRCGVSRTTHFFETQMGVSKALWLEDIDQDTSASFRSRLGTGVKCHCLPILSLVIRPRRARSSKSVRAVWCTTLWLLRCDSMV